MPAVTSSSNLVELIQKLETQQRQHAESATAITETLEHIGGLLGSLIGGQRPSAPVAAPRAIAAAAPAPRGPKPGARSKRTRNRFSTTGDESVLAFVRKHGKPTTAEVQAHWTSEGRGASADNSLSKLYKEKKVKRETNKQGRGSRYTIA